LTLAIPRDLLRLQKKIVQLYIDCLGLSKDNSSDAVALQNWQEDATFVRSGVPGLTEPPRPSPLAPRPSRFCVRAHVRCAEREDRLARSSSA
jgi:hypothetical protein